MACMYSDRSDAETRPNGLSEALLFATMCIIGLPVEVVLKDGSVYSGIFHTASLENDYGVVLKKARMIKKGKMKANTEMGFVIDTLVILSRDLVQVVAKGVLPPAGGFSGNVDGDLTEADGTVPTSQHQTIQEKKCRDSTMKISEINQTRDASQIKYGFAQGITPIIDGNQSEGRQLFLNKIEHVSDNVQQIRDLTGSTKFEVAPDDEVVKRGNQAQGDENDYGQKFEFLRDASSNEVCESTLSVISKHRPVNPSEIRKTKMTSKEMSNGLSDGPALAVAKQVSQGYESFNPVNTHLAPESLVVATSTTEAVDNLQTVHDSMFLPTRLAPPHSSESNKAAKEFKLNPEAKIFSPSFTNPISATLAVPTVGPVTYISNNTTVVPVTVAQPEVGFNSFSRVSVPAKVVPYGNVLAGNGGSGSQFSQPILGHIGGRIQPLRYAGEYPVHAGPAYVSQNSQSAMAGRFGQIVYVHPVPHDLVQASPTLSPICARPLLTSSHASFAKHQGNGGSQAVAMAPPFVGNGHPPVAVTNHIPLWQPSYPINPPIQISGSNARFTSKFS